MIDKEKYDHLLASVNRKYGYDFSEYADVSVQRRIRHFMQNRDIDEVETLERMLLNDELLFEQFIQGMSVTVTEMFRDPAFFSALREVVIKRLATYPVIKVWVAGCATGEEAYSIAILLSEEGLLHRTIIYATDINQRSLKIAKEGVYPIEGMQKFTRNYILSGGRKTFSDYYIAKYQAVIFDKTLREKILFSPHNLTADKSFNEFQIVLCRNVLMYFNQQLQNRVIDLIHESLTPFGFLGLGDKESLLFSSRRDSFEVIDSRQKIYMKVK